MSREHAVDKYTFTARPLHEVITENATRGLWMLLAATSLLLLIACTNVANLLLARAVVRERDLAIRASLGAGRRRLFGQVMGETIALGMLGSVVGIGLAWGLLRIFVSLAPVNFPRLAAITLDTGVLGFSLVVAVLAGLVAGLAPAIHLLRSDLNGVIRSGSSRSVTAGRARSASRLLVVSEVALALALVTTAGLMVKSLLRLQSQDLGITREPMLTFGVGVPPFVASGNDAVRRFQLEFLETRARAAGRHARERDQHAADWRSPATTVRCAAPIRPATPTACPSPSSASSWIATSRRWACRSSRDVRSTSAIAPARAAAAVVNETLAKRLFPTLDPPAVIGQAIRIGCASNGRRSKSSASPANVRSRRPDCRPIPRSTCRSTSSRRRAMTLRGSRRKAIPPG